MAVHVRCKSWYIYFSFFFNRRCPRRRLLNYLNSLLFRFGNLVKPSFYITIARKFVKHSSLVFFVLCFQLSVQSRVILFYWQDSIKASSQSSLCYPVCGKKIVDNRTSDDKNPKLSSRVRSMAHPVDRTSRILFPLAFYLFVMIYCLIFVIL